MRPDAGMLSQISADTAIVDHSAGRQQSTRRVTVAERPVSGLSCPVVAKVAVHRGNPGGTTLFSRENQIIDAIIPHHILTELIRCSEEPSHLSHPREKSLRPTPSLRRKITMTYVKRV